MPLQDLGNYSRQFITNVPYDSNDPDFELYKSKIIKSPLEGVYIYSFEKGRMIYAEGWEELIDIPDNEINMVQIVEMTAPDFMPFVHEINDKALKFLHVRHENLKEYSFKIELKIRNKNNLEIPVVARVSVFDTMPDGSLKCIMGRFQVDYGIRFGKIMRFSAYGPEKSAFENDLNESLFYPFRISDKELEVMRMLAKGYAYKEIANLLAVSPSAIEKRIRPMFQRFNVPNNTSLVAFAYENNLLP